MSVTLTGRDTDTLVFNMGSLTSDGAKYDSTGSSATVIHELLVRNSGTLTGPGKRRSNLQLKLRKFDATLGKWFVQTLDVTLTQDSAYTWSDDDADDIITRAMSYFDSEATSGAFSRGAKKG